MSLFESMELLQSSHLSIEEFYDTVLQTLSPLSAIGDFETKHVFV